MLYILIYRFIINFNIDKLYKNDLILNMNNII
jgi:hypothetical protein